MNWDDARFFLSIARTGKINRAAESLGVSPITLSRRMAHFQDQMNTRLFTRHNHGVELTQEGQRLVEFIERAEAEFEAANESFDRGQTSIQGTLRIAAPEGFALKVLSPRLGDLIGQHPDLNIEIVPLPRGFSLSRRDADMAIMLDRPNEAKFVYEKLGDYQHRLYAATDYLKRFGTPQNLLELKNHRLIGYVDDLLSSERLNTPRAIWPEWQSKISIYSPIGQLEAVRSGAGIGILHDYLVRNETGFIHLLPEIVLTRSFYIITHQNLAKLPRIEMAMRFLKSLSSKKL